MWDEGMGRVRRFRREIAIVALLLLSAGTLYGARAADGAALTDLKNQAQSNQTQIQQLTSSLARVPHISQAQLRQAARMLPARLDIPHILQHVSQLASFASVHVQSFQLTPAGAQGGAVAGNPDLRAYPVNMTVTGGQTQILAFIRGLENDSQLTTVDSIVITNTVNAGQMTAGISYSLYVNPGETG